MEVNISFDLIYPAVFSAVYSMSVKMIEKEVTCNKIKCIK